MSNKHKLGPAKGVKYVKHEYVILTPTCACQAQAAVQTADHKFFTGGNVEANSIAADLQNSLAKTTQSLRTRQFE